jgi:hypothetical protein
MYISTLIYHHLHCFSPSPTQSPKKKFPWAFASFPSLGLSTWTPSAALPANLKNPRSKTSLQKFRPLHVWLPAQAFPCTVPSSCPQNHKMAVFIKSVFRRRHPASCSRGRHQVSCSATLWPVTQHPFVALFCPLFVVNFVWFSPCLTTNLCSSVHTKCAFCDWFVSIMLVTSFNLIDWTKQCKPLSKWRAKTYIQISLDIWHLGFHNSLCDFNLLTVKECEMKFSNMFCS